MLAFIVWGDLLAMEWMCCAFPAVGMHEGIVNEPRGCEWTSLGISAYPQLCCLRVQFKEINQVQTSQIQTNDIEASSSITSSVEQGLCCDIVPLSSSRSSALVLGSTVEVDFNYLAATRVGSAGNYYQLALSCVLVLWQAGCLVKWWRLSAK